jgi:hypothetical protein
MVPHLLNITFLVYNPETLEYEFILIKRGTDMKDAVNQCLKLIDVSKEDIVCAFAGKPKVHLDWVSFVEREMAATAS